MTDEGKSSVVGLRHFMPWFILVLLLLGGFTLRVAYRTSDQSLEIIAGNDLNTCRSLSYSEALSQLGVLLETKAHQSSVTNALVVKTNEAFEASINEDPTKLRAISLEFGPLRIASVEAEKAVSKAIENHQAANERFLADIELSLEDPDQFLTRCRNGD